jgi:hypothetical protein
MLRWVIGEFVPLMQDGRMIFSHFVFVSVEVLGNVMPMLYM